MMFISLNVKLKHFLFRDFLHAPVPLLLRGPVVAGMYLLSLSQVNFPETDESENSSLLGVNVDLESLIFYIDYFEDSKLKKLYLSSFNINRNGMVFECHELAYDRVTRFCYF